MTNFAGSHNLKFIRTAFIACSLLAQLPAHAQQTLQGCSRIEDDTKRLACYDELAKPTDQSFGLQSAKVAEPEQQVDNIVATVVVAAHSPFTGWIITFDNGQSWKQIGTDSFAIRKGDSCTIERAVLDSFRLKCGDRARQIRVVREE